jgi:hypothetical protein
VGYAPGLTRAARAFSIAAIASWAVHEEDAGSKKSDMGVALQERLAMPRDAEAVASTDTCVVCCVVAPRARRAGRRVPKTPAESQPYLKSYTSNFANLQLI